MMGTLWLPQQQYYHKQPSASLFLSKSKGNHISTPQNYVIIPKVHYVPQIGNNSAQHLHSKEVPSSPSVGKITLGESPFQRLHRLSSSSSVNPPPFLETSFPLPVNHRGTTAGHHGPDPAFGVENRELQAGSALGIQVSDVGFLHTEQHTDSASFRILLFQSRAFIVLGLFEHSEPPNLNSS